MSRQLPVYISKRGVKHPLIPPTSVSVITCRTYATEFLPLTTNFLLYGGVAVSLSSLFRTAKLWHVKNQVYKKIERPYHELTSKVLPSQTFQYGTEWNPVLRTFRYAGQTVYVNETIPIMVKHNRMNENLDVLEAKLADNDTQPVEDRIVVIGSIEKMEGQKIEGASNGLNGTDGTNGSNAQFILKPGSNNHVAILSDPDTYSSSVYVRQTANEVRDYINLGTLLSFSGLGLQLTGILLECVFSR